MPDGLFVAEDGLVRCGWCRGSEVYRRYHDREWGFPVFDERRLFEKICLEGFQAGLSWLTILNKRESFRAAFANFDAERVARFDAKDVERLLGDAGIVRHRGKIESTINNARRVLRAARGVRLARGLRVVLGAVSRHAARAADARGAADARTVDGRDRDVEGPEAARLELRRPDDGLRLHAGDGAGRRPPRRLPRPPRHRGRARVSGS